MKTFFCVAAILAASGRIANGDHVDDVITAQMKERHIPGVAIAVIHDSKIVREQSYGYSDEAHRTPVTSSTLFQAASVSKPVAALGALHLVEQGKTSLDENINDKLRSWKVPENRFTKDHAVTLRLILSHSAGLTVGGFRGYPVGAPVPSLVQILDGQAPANSAPVRVDQVPGSQWRYSGGGYLVMQQMIIDVTGTLRRLHGRGRLEASRHVIEHIRAAITRSMGAPCGDWIHRLTNGTSRWPLAY